MSLKKRGVIIAAAIIASAALIFLDTQWRPSSKRYDSYSTINPQVDAVEGCTGMQAFGVGTDYCYSIKTNTGKLTTAIIYRTALRDGATVLMTNGDDGSNSCDYLSHANDMALAVIDGKEYMFVATMLRNEISMVRLRYEDTTYYKDKEYTVKIDGKNQPISGVAITGQDEKRIDFMFKYASGYYKGSLDLTGDSGVIDVAHAFTLDISNAIVDGEKLVAPSAYVNQGFEYYNDMIFHPVTKKNESIVFVCRNVSGASGIVTPDTDFYFRIVDDEHEKLFEIESLGHAPDGKLYFNTNRAKAEGGQYDGIHYFDRYKAK